MPLQKCLNAHLNCGAVKMHHHFCTRESIRLNGFCAYAAFAGALLCIAAWVAAKILEQKFIFEDYNHSHKH